MADFDLARLGNYVAARRTARGYRHRVQLAEAIGLSDRALADIENGVRPAARGTYAIIENELGWQPGSIAAILAGREPVELSEKTKSLDIYTTDELFVELYGRYSNLRDRAGSDGRVIPNQPKQLPFGRAIRTAAPGEDTRVRRDQHGSQ